MKRKFMKTHTSWRATLGHRERSRIYQKNRINFELSQSFFMREARHSRYQFEKYGMLFPVNFVYEEKDPDIVYNMRQRQQ